MTSTLSIQRLVALAGCAALLAIGLALLRPQTSHAAFIDTDGDGAIDVVEKIFGSNPVDDQSAPEDESLSLILSISSRVACADGVDNDHDGLVDGADSGCADADGDNISDAAELLLGSDPNDDQSFPEDARIDNALFALGFPLLTCADQEDDDGDGLTDAADPGCASVDGDGDGFADAVEKGLGSDWHDPSSQPEHDGINPVSCVDGVDNDNDGLVDLADPGCQVAPNDDLADAIVVDALPFTHTAKVVAATAELGEQESSCAYAGEGRQTVWYQFTPPQDTRVLIDTSGSDLLNVVSVWRQDALGLEEVACNSQFYAFLLPSAQRFVFAASAGQSYSIQVERYSIEEIGPLLDLGRLTFHMEAATPPPNDDFAAAQLIDALPITVSVDTVAAITELSEPNASCRYQGYPANSVWYRYTPAADAYVLAGIEEGTNFGATIGVYEGTSLASLEQVACAGYGELAFHAEAGHTYYLQAAGFQCQGPSGGGIASLCIDSHSGHLELRVETFIMPSCPPSQFTFGDPIGDAKEHFDVPNPIDARSLSIGFNAQYACVTVGFAPLPGSPQVSAEVDLDAELYHFFGASYDPFDCGPPGLAVDYRIEGRDTNQGLIAIIVSQGRVSSEHAYAMSSDTSLTYIVPLSQIGGDNTLRFAVLVFRNTGQNSKSFSDCAPNGGNITCQSGACAFVPFRNGDVNCNLRTDSVDAVITLQYSAGLFHTFACPDAADVNGDGRVDSLDASLILQFEAGLLDRLPPPPCRDPRFC